LSALHRIVGAASRRLGRPELLAVVDRHARRAEREELAVRALLAATLRDGDTYVDVGANRGQVLLEAARVAPRAHLIAFEPIPALAAELRESVPGLDCRELALGARAETAEFCHFKKLDGWSGLRRNPQVSDERGEPELIRVQVSTLDAELAAVDPRVVKVDVEGAELAVLEGAKACLSRARPLLVLEHVDAAARLYGASSGALWDLLAGLGYTIFSVTGQGPYERARFLAEDDVVNWLATPQSSRS
jgi:FkbM family methyltransferase